MREVCEEQIEEKSRHLREKIVPKSYKASIGNGDFEIFITAERIEASSINAITEQQVQQCIEEQCMRKVEEEQQYLVEQAVKSVTMIMQIVVDTDRVWTFRNDYCIALRIAGYGDLQVHKPHIAIGYILEKLKPHQMYKRMTDLVKRRKNETFEKENVDRFIGEVSRQTKKVQTEQCAAPGFYGVKCVNVPRWREPDLFRRNKIRYDALKLMPAVHKNRETKARGKKWKRYDNELPLCLDPTCRAKGEHHYLGHFAITDSKTKSFFGRVPQSEKSNHGGREKRVKNGGTRYRGHLVTPFIFVRGIICRKKNEVEVMADQSADANIKSKCLLDKVRNKYVPYSRKR